jgi:hypothetical protein
VAEAGDLHFAMFPTVNTYSEEKAEALPVFASAHSVGSPFALRFCFQAS